MNILIWQLFANCHMRNIDVLTALEAGRAGMKVPDVDQLVSATSQQRVMVSLDRDFVALSYSHVPHAGVIIIQRSLNIGDLVEYLELMAQITDVEDAHDRSFYGDW